MVPLLTMPDSAKVMQQSLETLVAILFGYVSSAWMTL